MIQRVERPIGSVVVDAPLVGYKRRFTKARQQHPGDRSRCSNSTFCSHRRNVSSVHWWGSVTDHTEVGATVHFGKSFKRERGVAESLLRQR
jgi:hypothetical protein